MKNIKPGSDRSKVLEILKSSEESRNSDYKLFGRLLELMGIQIPEIFLEIVFKLAILVDRKRRHLQDLEREEYYITGQWFWGNIQARDEVFRERNKLAFERSLEYKMRRKNI